MSQQGNVRSLPRGYRERKLLDPPVCARAGCSAPPAEDSDLCGPHRDEARARNRSSTKKLRRARRRLGLCRTPRCGRPAERSLCPECTVRLGRAPRGVVDNVVDNRARTWKDPDGRTRYHGQLRRGRQSNADLDAQDLRDGLRILQRALGAIPYLTSQEVCELPKAQRDGVRRAWLDEAFRGARHVLETLQRHGHETVLGWLAGEAPLGDAQVGGEPTARRK